MRSVFTKFSLKDERTTRDRRKTGTKTEVGWKTFESIGYIYIYIYIYVACIPITSQHAAHGPIDTGAVFPVHGIQRNGRAREHGRRGDGIAWWWGGDGWGAEGREAVICNETQQLQSESMHGRVCDVNAPYWQLGRS